LEQARNRMLTTSLGHAILFPPSGVLARYTFGEASMAKILEGIRVLDFGRFIACPFCGLLLASMGAEVIRVERPGGEADRFMGLMAPNGETFFMLTLGRNKKAITLDVHSPKGKEILETLVKRSDIIIDNFNPDAKKEMGLEYASLQKVNPRIIVASVSGFGQYGPYSHRRCFDPIAQAMSGSMSVTGFPGSPPTRESAPYVDMAAGLYAALGTVLCLYHRDRTGVGQEVDVSLLDTAISFIGHYFSEHLVMGEPHQPVGNQTRYGAANLYQAKDGWVFLSLLTDGIWRRFLRATGMQHLEGDPRFEDDMSRYRNRDVLDPMVARWVAVRTVAEVTELLDREGVPCGPVKTIPEAAQDPHMWVREMLVQVEHPGMGKIPLPGLALKLSETPGDVKAPAPKVGDHNEEIYCGLLGYSQHELAELRGQGII